MLTEIDVPPTHTDQAVYVPVSDGYAIGFRVEFHDARTDEFIYLNPSEPDDGVSNVFVYHGSRGKAWADEPQHFYDVGRDQSTIEPE